MPGQGKTLGIILIAVALIACLVATALLAMPALAGDGGETRSTVEYGPDLAVSAGDMVLSKSILMAGVEFNVSIKVYNLGDEVFGGWFGRGGDGRIFQVLGKQHCSVFEVAGLDGLRRLSGGPLALATAAFVSMPVAAQEAGEFLPEKEQTMRAMALMQIVNNLLRLGDLAGAERAARQARALVDRSGEVSPNTHLQVIQLQGIVSLFRADFIGAQRLFHEGLVLAERMPGGTPAAVAAAREPADARVRHGRR